MGKFRKPLIPLGTHVSPDGPVEVTTERVQRWIDKHHAIRANGNRIPVPWGHVSKAYPGDPEKDRDAAQFFRSRFNAGYLDGLEFNPQDNWLYGDFDVPGVEKDEDGNIVTWVELQDGNKVKTAIKEVSIGIDNWKDGQGQQWEDVIIHAALAPLPVVAGQAGFEPVSDAQKTVTEPQPLRLSTTTYQAPIRLQSEVEPKEEEDMADEAEPVNTEPTEPSGETLTSSPSSDMISRAVEGLARCGIKVPDDTTPENFLERLVIAIEAHEHTKDHLENENAPEAEPAEPEPETPAEPVLEEPVTEERPGGMLMSTATTKPVQKPTPAPTKKLADTAKTSAQNLSTTNGYSQHADPVVRALWADKEAQEQRRRLSRIENLKLRGLSVAKANELSKEASAIRLSLTTDGRIPKTELDRILDILEETLPESQYTRRELATDSVEVANPLDATRMDTKQMNDLADLQCRASGIKIEK